MKKFMFLAIVAVFATMNVFADNEVVNNEKTITISNDDYTCIEVKNVNANLDVHSNIAGKGRIDFHNYNNFPVNVSWVVYATNVNTGKESRVASGSEYLDKHGNNSGGGYAYFTRYDSYEAYYLEMRVEYCK